MDGGCVTIWLAVVMGDYYDSADYEDFTRPLFPYKHHMYN